MAGEGHCFASSDRRNGLLGEGVALVRRHHLYGPFIRSKMFLVIAGIAVPVLRGMGADDAAGRFPVHAPQRRDGPHRSIRAGGPLDAMKGVWKLLDTRNQPKAALSLRAKKRGMSKGKCDASLWRDYVTVTRALDAPIIFG